MAEGKIVYIASPYAGDIENNIRFAKAACRLAMEEGSTPVAAHLLYPQMLDDSIPEQRELGIRMGLKLLEACSELWLCGSRVSDGMQEELKAAWSQDKCIVEKRNLIRRLTPLECERLQGFPDGWTDIPGASDSARYKALGNSVAIPCVDFVLRGIAYFLRKREGRGQAPEDV